MFKTLIHAYKQQRKKVRDYLPERIFLQRTYRENTGMTLNLRHPTTFTDKIQWLKLYFRPNIIVQLVDKYGVREHVAKTVGQEYLIPLHGVYNTASEIRPETLPDQFVIKPTHGSGWVVLCPDKANFDWDEARKSLDHWMTLDFSKKSKEWAYGLIPPKIVCEAFLQDEKGQPPVDYKFFCADGRPLLCQVDVARFSKHARDLYDVDWNKLPATFVYPNAAEPVPKPESLPLMLELAAKLSKGLPFARVDLYEVKGKIYFGEITFYPEAGNALFSPMAFNHTLGAEITLPKPCKYKRGK